MCLVGLLGTSINSLMGGNVKLHPPLFWWFEDLWQEGGALLLLSNVGFSEYVHFDMNG